MARIRQKMESIAKRALNDLVWGSIGLQPTKSACTLRQWLAENPQNGHRQKLNRWPDIQYPARRCFGDSEAFAAEIEKRPPHEWARFKEQTAGGQKWSGAHPTVSCIDGGRVFSRWGIVVTPDDKLLTDVNSGTFAGTDNPLAVAKYHGSLPPAKRVAGKVAVLAAFSPHKNYYHWTVEKLPQIQLFEQCDSDVDYYYTHYSHPFHRELLNLFGIPESKVIPATRYSHIQADTLLVPQSATTVAHPAATDYLYSRLAALPWSRVASRPRRRLYISRRNSNWRRVENEGQLVDGLSKLGFESLSLEKMSVCEQVEAFQQAEFIIGPHGAGFANLVFSNSATKVIELGTPFRPFSCMYHIACARGHEYRFFLGKAIGGKNAESQILVDTKSIVSTAENMLEQRQQNSSATHFDKADRSSVYSLNHARIKFPSA